jgi:outer membrane protein assembly factor BamD
MSFSTKRNLPLLALAVSLSLGASGCLFRGHKNPAPLTNVKAAPDAVLFNNATNDIKHGRYTVGRLALQTLINTYPDSEYLAKAKLAIANSYYEQGGTDGLTQAVAQYNDFITFFPFLDEAAFAQYRVAMSHFRMMEKPDRDPTQALDAEESLQTMILKYPKSQWTQEAMQRLRDVQEVLAEGDFDVASFYDIRGAYGAAAARLLDLTARYPLFSQADQANFMLAKIYDRTEHADFAARFYARIVRDYPLSNLAPEAKSRLVALGYPVPQPDPQALARMREEEKYVHQRPGVVRQALGIISSGPDVSRAAHYGEPNLTPNTTIISAQQVLQPTVVAVASSNTTGGVGTIAAAVSSVPSSTLTASPASGSSVVAGASDTPPPAATAAEAQSAKDPAKGPETNEKKANDKKAKSKAQKNGQSTGQKKKGLLHKIVPW